MKRYNSEKAESIAYTAMFVSSISLLPQIIKVTKLQKVDELSIIWLILALCASILWSVYALKNNLRAQFIATSLGAIPIITLIILKSVWYRKNQNKHNP